jgi:cellulose synthase/poly-beta-1,6-N-acetylglucosamine synthase-like glycosyltransferase
MIPDLIANVFNYILSLDWERNLRVFWLFFIFDVPRYVIPDVMVFIHDTARRLWPDRREQAFLREISMRPPLVSVIIPVLNEEKTIAWTIKSLREQTYRNIEIIAVDDGSTDNTPDICTKLASNDKKFRYLRFSDRAGKSAALNYGLRFAGGKYVVFVDSDTTFDRDSIVNIIKTFSDPRVGGVSGNVQPRNGKVNLLTTLQHIEYLFSISVGRRIRAWFGILPIISGAFGAFRRDLIALETIGGHEPGPGNDSDLTIRVRKQGYKIAFAPEAVCLTNVPERFDKLIKQRWRWDRNLIKNRVRKHRDLFNPFSRNFMLRNTLSSIDSILSHVAIAFLTVAYLIDVSIHFPHVLVFLLAINLVLYTGAEFLELMIAIALSRRWEDLRLVPYLPLFHPFKMLLKVFRLIGYGQEFIFSYSYRDPFAPPKVRERMIRW